MKKLLNILGLISITSTMPISLVSCTTTPISSVEDDDEPEEVEKKGPVVKFKSFTDFFKANVDVEDTPENYWKYWYRESIARISLFEPTNKENLYDTFYNGFLHGFIDGISIMNALSSNITFEPKEGYGFTDAAGEFTNFIWIQDSDNGKYTDEMRKFDLGMIAAPFRTPEDLEKWEKYKELLAPPYIQVSATWDDDLTLKEFGYYVLQVNQSSKLWDLNPSQDGYERIYVGKDAKFYYDKKDIPWLNK